MVGLAQADPHGFAIRAQGDADRGHVIGAHALHLEVDGFLDTLVPRADHTDAGAQFVGHPQLFAVSRQRKAAWTVAHADVFQHLARLEVNQVNHVGHLGRHIRLLAVGRHKHTFGFTTGGHLKQLGLGGQVVGGQGVFVFNGNIGRFAVRAQAKHFRAVTQGHGAGQLAAGGIDQTELVAVATHHVDLAATAVELHVARPLAHLNGGLGRALGVKHINLVVFFT